MQVHRRRRRLALTSVAVGALAAAGLTFASANQALAEEGCEVDYNLVSTWNGGFQANVVITADEPINGWEVKWNFPSGTTVSSAWNVDWSQSGAGFTGGDVGWNASIASGQSKEVFGFIGNGSSATPGQFTVNGDVCNGPSEPPDDRRRPPTTRPATRAAATRSTTRTRAHRSTSTRCGPRWPRPSPAATRSPTSPPACGSTATSAIYGNGSPTTG